MHVCVYTLYRHWVSQFAQLQALHELLLKSYAAADMSPPSIMQQQLSILDTSKQDHVQHQLALEIGEEDVQLQNIFGHA